MVHDDPWCRSGGGTDLSCHRRRALGANPVTINFDQALIAFQQGTVDGQENPIALIVPYKLWEVGMEWRLSTSRQSSLKRSANKPASSMVIGPRKSALI